MKRGQTHMRLARFVLEAQTPLSLTTGVSSDTFDTALVRDANGLPAIPGSSLRGALRSQFQQRHGLMQTEALFGFVRGEDGEASDLEVGWGRVLDSHGKPVDGLLVDGARSQDDLLTWYLTGMAARPPTRDGVRLNARGVTDGRGKYDRAVLPKGARFAVDLALFCSEQDDDTQSLFDDLLGIIAAGFPLGGGTGRGLGRMALAPGHPIRSRTFDLRKPDDLGAMVRAHADPGAVDDTFVPMEPADGDGDCLATISVRPDDIWRMGRGTEPLDAKTFGDKPPDLVPYREPIIVWTAAAAPSDGATLCNGTGVLDEGNPRLLLAGSGVKGALRHRTVFHYRRLTGDVIDPKGDEPPTTIDGECVVRILFGAAREKDGEGPATAGLFSIDDVLFTVNDHGQRSLKITRNSIDRFTGGTIDHVLYDEQVLISEQNADKPFTLSLRWRPLRPEAVKDLQGMARDEAAAKQTFKTMLDAFRCALDDLCTGRLPLGAGGGRGAGTCVGEHGFDPDQAFATLWPKAPAPDPAPDPAEAGS